MKKLTKIFVFFALTILFASSAYAQYNIPDPPKSERAESRCVSPDPNSVHSPSEACRAWERTVYCEYLSETWTISGSGDYCNVTSYIALNGRYNYYYSGDQYCRERIGSSFDNFKKCELRTDIAQPTSKPKPEPTPGSQSETQLEIAQKKAVSLMNENKAKLEKETKRIDDMMRQRNEKDAANSQLNQFQALNNALKNLMEDLGASITKLKNWAGSIFDGAKNFFKK